jgi:hypothetical protein
MMIGTVDAHVNTLPAWCDRVIAAFDDLDVRARTVAADLTPQQINWPPAPGSWSIGQCLEHLAIANDHYLPAIEEALDRNRPDHPVDEIVLRRLSRWFIQTYIEPSDTTRRAKAPRKISPPSTIGPEVLDRLLRGNEHARQVVRRAGAYDVNRIRFKNPFVPLVRFTIGTGLELLSGHERRHLLQAERVRTAAGFPHQR